MPHLSPGDSLFYFCALNSSDRKSWLQRLLLDNQIYFRSRSQLNDPNELRPTVVFKGTDKQIRKYVRELIVSHYPVHLSPAARLIEENKLIYTYRNMPQHFEETLHQLLDGIGLFCVSETPMDPLLWAHYADGHRGVCIEFSPNLGPFGAAQKVTYVEQPPIINRLVDSPTTILEKSMLTKGVAWSYEREWRVIARFQDEDRTTRYFAQHNVPTAIEEFMRNQHGPGYYSFPSEAIRSVVLGSRIATDDETWIQSILNQTSLSIPVKRASLGRDDIIAIS